MNKTSLDLIVIDDDLEALALRSALEWWNVKVTLYLIGKSQDLVDVFQKEELSNYICIAAHGDKINNHWGFQLPELGVEVAKRQPYNKVLFASDISKFIKLNDHHILSLACLTGNQEIAAAFLNNGAKSYTAPKDAPFGNSSLYFALNFYYCLFVKEKTVKGAYDKAISIVDVETDKFVLFER